MNRLQSEWQRLYLAHSPESTPQASSTDSPASAPTPPTPGDAMTEAAAGNTPSLVTPGGRVRALVLELGRPADWDALLAVWQGVQADLVSRHQPSVGGGDFDLVEDVAEVGRKMMGWRNTSSHSALKKPNNCEAWWAKASMQRKKSSTH